MLELFSLKGKVAIVTGASRGLGKPVALGMAAAGAHVVLVARDAGRLEAELRARGVSVAGTDYGSAVTYTLAVEPGGGGELESTLAALTSGAVAPSEAGTSWVEY